ncbi:MAG: hypothetical protein QXH30_01070 [Candidatus Bilamarchaeaceae archaeon]
MVIKDEAGRMLATTGQRGTPSLFTDERGNTRSLICYMSYYCVDETPCEETCGGEECVDYGQMCGYWPGQAGTAAATNVQSGGKDYGECCPPYECINGYCGKREECRKENEMCGLVYPSQAYTTAYVNQQPTDYGECCPPYECVNNRCTPAEECVKTGNLCGRVQDPSITTHLAYKDYGDCCEPDQCINNRCAPPEEQCVETGGGCGTYTYYTGNQKIENYLGMCCPPAECVNNVCTEEEPCVPTGRMCGYGPATSATYASVQNRTWYGDCCEGNICTNGYCVAQCGNAGEKCDDSNPCCSGLECEGGVCTRPCVGLGETCAVGRIECCSPYFCVSGKCATCQPGGYACKSDAECCENYFCGDNGRCERYSACMKENAECSKDSDCCDGLVCFDGICKEEGTCTDTDQGKNQYSQGTATGSYQGDYGSYTDYCFATGASMLYEYYCDGDEVAVVAMTCPQGCTNGKCN